MPRSSSQSGQVLVGTLVIMVLIFAMAGAVALAASSLLDRQTSHRTAVEEDLRASDAIAAAVADKAGRGLDVKAPQPLADCSPGKTFSNPLPGKDGTYWSTVSCLRFDEVASPDVSAIVLTWTGGCATAAVPLKVREWIFFNALASAGITAWVDNQVSCGLTAFARAECRFASPPGKATVGQAAIDCGAQPGNSFLHIVNSLSSPAVVRIVANSTPPPTEGGGGEGGVQGGGQGGGSTGGGGNPPDTNGSIYELAATTGLLGPGQQFEEGIVFVARDGKTALVSEGSL